MKEKIRLGIVGYGNLGRGVEASISQNKDLELVAVFSRRDPKTVETISKDVKVCHYEEIVDYVDKIDVMILCGGSAKDLPEQGPELVKLFNTVDSYDNHGEIPNYFAAMDENAQASGKTGLISVGWDPGLFSINRVMAEAILPVGQSYTFWGKGLSQGHSDAVRRVPGVKNGVQYTIPSERAMDRVRKGENPELTTNEKHERICYVVLEEGADAKEVKNKIVTMPNYFADYNTTVNFISEAELLDDHQSMPHGGFVIHSGQTGEGDKQIYEFSLKLDSNPQFTASVLTAYARAAFKLNQTKQIGAKTVYDVPPAFISPHDNKDLRKRLL